MLWKIAYADRLRAERRQADGALDKASRIPKDSYE